MSLCLTAITNSRGQLADVEGDKNGVRETFPVHVEGKGKLLSYTS